MKSPLCQLADVAIALHARENRSTISPPPLTAISTLTTGTTVTSVRSDSSLTPQHIRARRYAICIERERPPVDIAGGVLTRQKQFQNYYQQQQQTQPATQNSTVRALPPLRYHYNPISYRQQTGVFRTNLRRATAQTATTTSETATTTITTTTTTATTVDSPVTVMARKKTKIEDKNSKINKPQISQQHVEGEQKLTKATDTTTDATTDLQLKIKTVEQLQQEQNLELLIKASEQHEKHLDEEGEEEKRTGNAEKQQVVEELITDKEKEITVVAAEIEVKTDTNLNVIDLTDSDDDTLSKGATSQTSTQCNHRRRKRHHRRHRRRPTQNSVLGLVKEQNNEKTTKSTDEVKPQQQQEN